MGLRNRILQACKAVRGDFLGSVWALSRRLLAPDCAMALQTLTYYRISWQPGFGRRPSPYNTSFHSVAIRRCEDNVITGSKDSQYAVVVIARSLGSEFPVLLFCSSHTLVLDFACGTHQPRSGIGVTSGRRDKQSPGCSGGRCGTDCAHCSGPIWRTEPECRGVLRSTLPIMTPVT